MIAGLHRRIARLEATARGIAARRAFEAGENADVLRACGARADDPWKDLDAITVRLVQAARAACIVTQLSSWQPPESAVGALFLGIDSANEMQDRMVSRTRDEGERFDTAYGAAVKKALGGWSGRPGERLAATFQAAGVAAGAAFLDLWTSFKHIPVEIGNGDDPGERLALWTFAEEVNALDIVDTIVAALPQPIAADAEPAVPREARAGG